MERTHGASVGVSGLDGGSGISIRVGVAMLIVLLLDCAEFVSVGFDNSGVETCRWEDE